MVRFYSTEQVALKLGVTTRTVAKWRAKGLLRATKLGPRAVRYSEDDVAEFVRMNQTAAVAAATN